MPASTTPPGSNQRRSSDSAHSVFHSIVVATDGHESSDCALTLAQSLATEQTSVSVISVCEPMPPAADWSGLGIASSPVSDLPDPQIEREARVLAIRQQVARVLGVGAHWPVSVLTGSISESIARFAHDTESDLVITGRGRHGLIDRVLGAEHLVSVLRDSAPPVLAAEPTFCHRPRRIVVALGFGDHPTDIAHVASMLVAPGAAMYLVHVATDRPHTSYPESWRLPYEEAAREHLEHLRLALDLPRTTAVEVQILKGAPAPRLIEFASAAHADLLVVGTQGDSIFGGRSVGSVAKHLLRSANCSLLAVPYAFADRLVYARTIRELERTTRD